MNLETEKINIIIDEIDYNNPDYDHFDLAKRNDFQNWLMFKMIGRKPSVDEELKWTEDYGKMISNIIDNKRNYIVRDLITNRNYEEAFNVLADVLKEKNKEKGSLTAAA